ncbi:AI-2E family transporter [Cohnella suwonensis]|uniref:AI-2E family transporter n=1 Tax=Cohnella suwonensis TaxID=696072 RepID=A0ABW0LZ23_9BACL
METAKRKWSDRVKWMLLNQQVVLVLVVILLISLNIFVLDKISYIFHPFIVVLETVFLPFLLTGVGFYLLNPIVDFLERRNIARGYTIAVLYLIIATAITIIVMRVVPLLSDQISGLVSSFPDYSQDAQAKFEEWVGSDSFNQIQSTLGIDTSKLAHDFSGQVSSVLNNAWSGIGGLVSRVTHTILSIITVPLILFYLLRDRKKLTPYVLDFAPSALRGRALRVLLEMNQQISSYIRGQILVSFCVGLLLYIGYLIIGLDYSLVLAVIAACTSVVPYVGPAIAIMPALVVAMVTSPIMLLKMAIIWTIVQVIEGKVISPQVMGKAMRVHPITIIFAILTAGNLFGLVGIILAVPGYAILKVITTHLFRWFRRKSGLYDPADDETVEERPDAPPEKPAVTP